MAGQSTPKWIAERFGTELAIAIQSTAEERPAVECSEGAPDAGETFWWEQGLSCGPGATLWAGAARESWHALGSKVLLAAGIETTDDDARSTYQEVLTQALSALADSLGARAGTEIHATQGKEVQAPEAGEMHRISLTFRDGSTAAIHFHASAEVERAVEPDQIEEAPAPVPPAEPQPVAAPVSMDLLLDVELPVTVVFGRTHVRLQEVLKLNTGSIVELDRTILEPVDIVVNNCVIARGDVVVVDGNYGVRISEIVSRSERLRTSRSSLGSVQRRADHRGVA
jgi:flagellar motor switch protein FliN/FliY